MKKNPISFFYRRLYFPLCRSYARKLGDNPADSLMCLLYSIHFFRVRKYWPKLNKNSKSFEEKLACRMLFDRNPLWTLLSDKAKVREYVASKASSNYLIPLLWRGIDPDAIPFDELSPPYVIKASHGCLFNIFIKDSSDIDREKIKSKLKNWLASNFCENNLLGTSWAYKNIKPSILIESFIGDDGQVPTDYKFFCFSGRAEFLQMNFDRFGNPFEKTLDRDFKPLDLWTGEKQYRDKISRPDNYHEMISLAETISDNLPFIRVDLYNIKGRIFFGELTCYPGGGMVEWKPREYDYLFGKKWI